MATNKRIIRSNDEAAGGASFNTVLYTGNGGTLPVTDVGFEPDFVWIKSRNDVGSHIITDSVRGNGKEIYPDLTNAEGTLNRISLTYTGFDVNSVSYPNKIGDTYVAWCWKAGGSAVTNTDGTITSQVSANTEAGFSIVSWTGNNLANATIGHGLEDTPKVTIIKKRTSNVYALGWQINLDSSITGSEGYLNFDTSAMYTAFPNYYTSANSTVLSTNGTDIPERQYNNQLENYIAYCFAEVAGFSKFGSYSGIDDTDVKVYTDSNGDGTGTGAFQPRFVMIKLYNNTGGSWAMFDALRDGGNPTYNLLFANLANAESTYSNIYGVQFDSDGFTVKGHTGGNDQINETGGSYIFMAFA